MRTTTVLDADLLALAGEFTGLKQKSEIIREALQALIHRESAKRLAQVGGSQSALAFIPRRQSDTK